MKKFKVLSAFLLSSAFFIIFSLCVSAKPENPEEALRTFLHEFKEITSKCAYCGDIRPLKAKKLGISLLKNEEFENLSLEEKSTYERQMIKAGFDLINEDYLGNCCNLSFFFKKRMDELGIDNSIFLMRNKDKSKPGHMVIIMVDPISGKHFVCDPCQQVIYNQRIKTQYDAYIAWYYESLAGCGKGPMDVKGAEWAMCSLHQHLKYLNNIRKELDWKNGIVLSFNFDEDFNKVNYNSFKLMDRYIAFKNSGLF